jgi:hypothetical protein
VIELDPNPADGAGFGSIALFTTATVDVVIDVYGFFTAPGAPMGNAWSLTGNAGTNPATTFLGTTDNQPLVIKIIPRSVCGTSSASQARSTARADTGPARKE